MLLGRKVRVSRTHVTVAAFGDVVGGHASEGGLFRRRSRAWCARSRAEERAHRSFGRRVGEIVVMAADDDGVARIDVGQGAETDVPRQVVPRGVGLHAVETGEVGFDGADGQEDAQSHDRITIGL